MQMKLPQAHILIVDDDEMQRTPMRVTLENAGFIVTEANNGLTAFELYQKTRTDLIISDIIMPGIDGFELCRQIKNTELGKYHPILLITGLDDLNSINLAYEVGATDFLVKPLNWDLLGHKVNYILRSARTAKELALSESLLRKSELEVINRLGLASEFKDNETGNHIRRMSLYSEALSREYGLNEQECHLIKQAAPMHDVGKVGIPDRILLKPGKLTEEEFKQMQQHVTMGAEILSGVLSKLMEFSHLICISHHEKWDGTGYPYGLKGKDIPIYGRICAIADVFDALTSERPYKTAWDENMALNEIQRLSGSAFDPQLVTCFTNIFQEILHIKNKFKD